MLVALFWPPIWPPHYFTAFQVDFRFRKQFHNPEISGQLAAVLLSLGVYTWVEHSLRDKLARILDASIGARKEVEGRRKVIFPPILITLFHYSIVTVQHREGSAWVILVNLIFGLLAMFHLAYLGVMFDQSSPEQVYPNKQKIDLDSFPKATGYSWWHTVAKWRRLDFTSHYLVGGMAIVNWLL